MKYVIIGNGAAGIAAAEKIRKLDSAGEITIMSSEGHPVYSKCLLPDFLSGQLSPDRMFIRDKDFYINKKFNILYRHKVSKVDFRQKTVYAEVAYDSGLTRTTLEYDKLLIATGSTQIMPPVKGLDHSNSYFISTLDEAKKALEASKAARRILIIGAGFVGLETAFNFYKNGKEVTVVEKRNRILEGQLDDTASNVIGDSIQEEGIRLMLGVSVSEVSSSIYSNISKLFTGSQAKTVILDDGRRLKADMIIVSAGSRPSIDFLKGSPLKINTGIVVDRFMQTSEKDVYAAGDVVETVDAVTGKTLLSPIWPNAVIQGETAGSNMTGKAQEFDSLISMQNASEFREIPMITMGITSPDASDYEELIDYRPFDMIYRKLVIKDNIIVGMIFLGDIRNAGVIGALMKQKTGIEKIKSSLLNPNFGYSHVGMFS